MLSDPTNRYDWWQNKPQRTRVLITGLPLVFLLRSRFPKCPQGSEHVAFFVTMTNAARAMAGKSPLLLRRLDRVATSFSMLSGWSRAELLY